MTAVCAVICSLILALLTTYSAEPNPATLGAAVAVCLVSLLGTVVRWPARFDAAALPAVRVLLWVLLATSLYLQTFSLLAVADYHLHARWPGVIGAMVVEFLLIACAFRPKVGERWRFPAILVLFGSMSLWAIWAWNAPEIDVWRLQQDASRELRSGHNPYTATHPEILWKVCCDGLPVRDASGHMRSFPYPPLSLLCVLPAEALLGDVRYALLAAILGSAVLIRTAGRRLGLPAGHMAELAVFAILFHPHTPFIVSLAFTDPLVAFGSAVMVWASVAGHGRLVGVALAAVVTVKQFGFLWIVPALAARRATWSGMVLGGAIAGAVIVPFFVWDPSAFLLGTVTYLTSSPLRGSDSLSLGAYVANARNTGLSPIWPFLFSGIVLLGVWRRAGGSLARTTMGTGATLLTFVVFGKAGNLNYFWLADALFLYAAVLALGEGTGSASASESVPPEDSEATSAGAGPGDSDRTEGVRA